MGRTTKSWLWAALAVSVLLSLAWEAYPLPDASRRLEALTLSAVGFTGVDIPLTEAEERVFGGANVLKRVYRRGGACFLLMVIDGTQDRHRVHDPMYCIRGAGWSVVGEAEVPMAGGRGQWLRLKKRGQEGEVIYWFSDGVSRYASPVKYWCQTTLRRLTLGALGGEPVLLLVQPCGATPMDCRRIIEMFTPLREI